MSPLVSDNAFALEFRVREPVPAAPRSLLVLLHGVGGNESNLAGLAATIPAQTLVVLPRGRLALGPDQFAWFRVAFTSAGPQIVAEEAEESRRVLIRFIQQLQTRYHVGPEHTTIAGFSQGGILSASVGLSTPELVSAFAVLAGRILPELEPAIASRDRLARLRGFIAHGRHDDKLPVAWAQRADAWLTTLGVAHETRIYPIGHALSPAMTEDFVHWLDAATTDAATLRLEGGQTTLTASGVTTIIAPGPARINRDHMLTWPPRPQDIELAIADIEDALMQVHRKVGNPAFVASDDPVLLQVAEVAGLDNAQALPREKIEAAFERLAAVALGRPNAQERLPEDGYLAAAIVILREVMHHLDIRSIALRHKGASV